MRLRWGRPVVAAIAGTLAWGAACGDPGAADFPIQATERSPWSPATGELADVVELTAERIQQDYATGRYGAVDLVEAYLARVGRYEGVYNAFVSMNPAALDIAAALDEEYRSSGPRGPLHGVPVVIKDNIDYGGLVTTAGYDGFSAAAGGIDMIPERDAEVVARN